MMGLQLNLFYGHQSTQLAKITCWDCEAIWCYDEYKNSHHKRHR